MNSSEILSKLIHFPSISSQPNDALIAWCEDFLRGVGMDVEVLPSPQTGKANLFARLGPAVSGGVILAGHSDVVPVEGQNWSHDPFTLIEKEGKFFGRGSCDMKGFIACAMAAAEKAQNKKLHKPLYIALTHDEEEGMTGAKELTPWLVERKIKADWLWLGEPTMMKPVAAHKGVAVCETRIKGVAGHSSLPDNGLNALYLAAEVVLWVRQMAQEKKAKPFSSSAFTPAYTTMNVGAVHGGKVHNIICDHASLIWDYRLHPGDDGQDIWESHNALLNTLRQKMASFPAASIETLKTSDNPPFDCSKNNGGVDFCCACAGLSAPLAAPYATEASFFQATGMPIIICGPGNIAQAHQGDEFVAKDQLALCDTYLEKLIETL